MVPIIGTKYKYKSLIFNLFNLFHVKHAPKNAPFFFLKIVPFLFDKILQGALTLCSIGLSWFFSYIKFMVTIQKNDIKGITIKWLRKIYIFSAFESLRNDKSNQSN